MKRHRSTQTLTDEDEAELGTSILESFDPLVVRKFDIAIFLLGIHPENVDHVRAFLLRTATECNLAGLALILDSSQFLRRSCQFMLGTDVPTPILDEHVLIGTGRNHMTQVFQLFANHPGGGLLFFEELVDHFCFDCPSLVDVFWECTHHIWEAPGGATNRHDAPASMVVEETLRFNSISSIT